VSGFTVNVVVQSGNLTRDPELRSLPSGTELCKLGLAVNERFKDSMGEWTDRANYFNWTVWGGLGRWVAENFQTGDAITLSGRARWHSWVNDSGDKRSAVEFTADSIIPGRPGKGGQTARDRRMEEQDSYYGQPPDGEQTGFTPRSDIPTDGDDGFAPMSPATGGPPDDDIPF
jgi:single-strand DNA-binding protein